MSNEATYARAKAERQSHVDAILKSPAGKKIVVAGAGTGKTTLFEELLKGKKKTLTLSFVNTLVEDLSLSLAGLTEVRTLHGFAHGALRRASGAKALRKLSEFTEKDSKTGNETLKVYAHLSDVIRRDAQVLLDSDVDFERLFHDRHDDSEHLKFYRERQHYYRHFGFSALVFAIVKLYEGHRDKILPYELVLVDEFQDFSKLEVSLIDLLSERSPIVLAGDDDQALYADLKRASSEYIRQKCDTANSGYEKFTLPFCSRSTRAIVNAANDIISKALAGNHLRGRIEKGYKYFECEKKDHESQCNPKIIHARVYARKLAYFIEKEIAALAETVRKEFNVLVIGPSNKQLRLVVNALKSKGLSKISFSGKKEHKVTLLDGLKCIMMNRNCNLGWRIAAECLLERSTFESAVKQSANENGKNFADLLKPNVRKTVTGMVRLLKRLAKGSKVDPVALCELCAAVGAEVSEIIGDELLESTHRVGKAAIRNIPIKVTTVQGSKGLAADCVFITHFDDQYFIKERDKSKITDHDICKFLVAVTRARTRLYLLSTHIAKEPTFLSWINRSYIEELPCDSLDANAKQ